MTRIDTKNKDVLLATVIASGATATAAAQQLNMSLSSIQRRMAKPSFRTLVTTLRAEMVECVLGRMTERLTRATEAVAELLDSPVPHIRLRAARLMFQTSMRLRSAVEVDQQIRELRDEVNGREGVRS
jgi:hypothetical protein